MNGNEGRFGLDFERNMVVKYGVPISIKVRSVCDVVPRPKVQCLANLRNNPVISVSGVIFVNLM